MTTFGDQVYQYGGVPVGVGETPITGSTFFVDSANGNDGNTGKSTSSALATVDKAIGLCTANKGDVIYVMPNHAETLGDNKTSLVPDVAGISIIGIGNGDNMPTFTYGGQSSEIEVGADNILFKNLRFVAGIDAITLGIDVNGHYFTMEDCVMDYGTATFDWVDYIDISAFDYAKIRHNKFIAQAATEGANTAIHFVDANYIEITNNFFLGDFAEAPIWNITTAGVGILIADNVIYNDDTDNADNGISLQAACTGIIARNLIGTLYATNITTLIDPGSCLSFDNRFCNAIDEYAALTGPGNLSA